VSRRQSVEALAGLLLLLLALAAGLLSRGMADAASDFRAQQAAWEQGLAPHAPAASDMFERVAERLLGIRARSQVQAAYVDYRQKLWFESASTLFRQAEARSNSIDRISALRDGLESAKDRSRVDVTLCVLSALNASASVNQRRYLLGRAVDFCREALRQDSANAEAKVDLELLLDRMKQAQGTKARSQNSGSRNKRPKDRPAATPHTQRERRVGY
jgi:hypothetical protein